jgi:hypothetical protein
MNNKKDFNDHESEQVKNSFINKEIKHLMQKTNNDCGVACIKMAIK